MLCVPTCVEEQSVSGDYVSLDTQIHACYHYMPDTTRYDDRKISSMMRKSSVIMIGLSPAYLSSQRYVLTNVCCADDGLIYVRAYVHTYVH